jgi:hypothetical protein
MKAKTWTMSETNRVEIKIPLRLVFDMGVMFTLGVFTGLGIIIMITKLINFIIDFV